MQANNPSTTEVRMSQPVNGDALRTAAQAVIDAWHATSPETPESVRMLALQAALKESLDGTEPTPVIRPRAQLVRVHDADTYLLLLDLHARGLSEEGCESVWLRLRGYSGRELSDTAPDDPKGLGRIDGPAARDAAQAALAGASEILVELQGPAGAPAMSFDRLAATIYVDGNDLGELLAAQHAVVAGEFEGVSR